MKRIAVVVCLAASPAAADVGRIVQAEGGLILRGTETIVAEEGVTVDQGDLLQTTASGLIHVLMTDETKFVVGPGTSISIDTALIGGDGGTFESLAVGMTGGLLRMISGNSENEAYQLNTPAATMGIRGTAFDTCRVRDDLLIVHEGIVQTCLRNPLTGEVDLASCTDSAAEENTCPVVAARVGPDGDGTIGPAEGDAVLQCRLSYEQEELGVLEDFRIDDSACRAAAEAASQNPQPDDAQPGDNQSPGEPLPPEEGEDDTRNTPPARGNRDQASATPLRPFTTTSSFLALNGGGGGGNEVLCSKDDLLESLGERVGAYAELIGRLKNDSAADARVILGYEAALSYLRSAISDVARSRLTTEDCATLLATIQTNCTPAVSPASLENSCIIAIPNRGF
jgi:hypothetical protein